MRRWSFESRKNLALLAGISAAISSLGTISFVGSKIIASQLIGEINSRYEIITAVSIWLFFMAAILITCRLLSKYSKFSRKQFIAESKENRIIFLTAILLLFSISGIFTAVISLYYANIAGIDPNHVYSPGVYFACVMVSFSAFLMLTAERHSR